MRPSYNEDKYLLSEELNNSAVSSEQKNIATDNESEKKPIEVFIVAQKDNQPYMIKASIDNEDKKVSEKSDVIKKILSDFSIKPGEALMIGDREYDTDGAANHGVASIGVSYGYGKIEVFGSAFAVVDDVDGLAELLKRH